MQKINRLSATAVSKLNDKGFYPDGAGLHLQIGKHGGKSWIFRYQHSKKPHDMGLGGYPIISLSEARRRADECRRMLSDGLDPLIERVRKAKAAAAEAAKAVTFEECARRYIDIRRRTWKDEKSASQWASSLKTYAYPVFGQRPVQELDESLVLAVLEPIWPEKFETASRLRGRIEAILEWAMAHDLRSGANPAKWDGKVKVALSSLTGPRKAKHHHNALPYAELPQFMFELRRQGGMAARALEFIILTATRRREAMEARWSEIDFDKAVWTIPEERMKAGKEHRVPLSKSALRLLKSMNTADLGELIFPNPHTLAPMSDMGIANLLKRMKRTDITTHGFRSSFRDWIAAKTKFGSEVAEMALAHAIANQVEAAYRRGDLFEKRKPLMEAWAGYCEKPRREAQIISIGQPVLVPAKAA